MINGLSGVVVPTDDQLLCGVVGGALMGLGMGMVFTQGGTTGGSDIIVKLLRIRFRYLKTGIIFAITDTVIVACSALVFKNIENGLYAGISLAVQTIVFDLVLYGPDEAKSLLIISDEARTVARRLMDELDVGVTYLNGNWGIFQQQKSWSYSAPCESAFPKGAHHSQRGGPGRLHDSIQCQRDIWRGVQGSLRRGDISKAKRSGIYRSF